LFNSSFFTNATSGLSRWLQPTMVGSALAVAFVLLAGLRLVDVYQVETAAVAEGTAEAGVQAQQATGTDIRGLAALEVFGTVAPVQQAVKAVATKDLPKTRLKLVLKAAFTVSEESSENRKASALIGESKRAAAKRYYIGDRLPGGARLHAVYPDSVTLERAGKLESLEFPRAAKSIKQNYSESQYSSRSQPGYNRVAPSPATNNQARIAQRQAEMNRLQRLRQKQAQRIQADLDDEDEDFDPQGIDFGEEAADPGSEEAPNVNPAQSRFKRGPNGEPPFLKVRSKTTRFPNRDE